MRQPLAALVLLATLTVGGCAAWSGPHRNIANDPAVGSDEQSFELRPSQGTFSSGTFNSNRGMVAPNTGSNNMPMSRNSMPQ